MTSWTSLNETSCWVISVLIIFLWRGWIVLVLKADICSHKGQHAGATSVSLTSVVPALCALPSQTTPLRPCSLVWCTGVETLLICSGGEWSHSNVCFCHVCVLWQVDGYVVTSAFAFLSFKSKHVSPLFVHKSSVGCVCLAFLCLIFENMRFSPFLWFLSFLDMVFTFVFIFPPEGR